MSFNCTTKLYDGYIYKITNSINGKIYIGQTSTDIKHRWAQHKCDAKHGRQTVIENAIIKYGDNNFDVEEVITVSARTKGELKEVLDRQEIAFIDHYNSISPNGYNVAIGGSRAANRKRISVVAYNADGSIYKKYDSATEAMDEMVLIGYSRGSNKISMCCKGKIQCCCGFVWRYDGDPFDKYEVVVSQKQIDQRCGKRTSIDKYDLDGNYLCTFTKFEDALESIGKKRGSSGTANNGTIRKCCEGKVNNAYGFVWRYSGESFDCYPKIENRCFRPINVYDVNMNLLKEYPTLTSSLAGEYLKSYGVLKVKGYINNQDPLDGKYFLKSPR